MLSILALAIRYAVRGVIGPPRTKGETDRWPDYMLSVHSITCFTPREPLCGGDSGDRARPRQRTHAPPPWRRLTQNASFSPAAAADRGSECCSAGTTDGDRCTRWSIWARTHTHKTWSSATTPL